MDKKAKRADVSKPLYIVLSIIIACALWLYVRNVDNPETKIPVKNIPVTLVGEDILNDNNLMLVSGRRSTVNLEFQGKWSVVSRLRRDNITITADLSRITGPGEYNLAYEINTPNGVSQNNVSVIDRDPFYITVEVSRRTSNQIELRGVFTGSVAKGYQAGEFTFQPAAIEVSGEETQVAQVAYAQVTLNREELSETVKEEMSYTLIGQDGNPIENDGLITTPATVGVTLPVVMVKEVPLTVDFTPGGGVTGEDTQHLKYEISPQSIVLAGDEKELAAYTSIPLGSIDLSKVIRGDTFTFPIPIGQEVENVSGVQEATVEVKVEGLETRTFETENIEIIGDPEGVAELVTQSLQVQVRGSTEALDMILPQYIRVVVDLEDLTLPAGQNSVTPKVTLTGVADAGVIGDYKVSISLSRRI